MSTESLNIHHKEKPVLPKIERPGVTIEIPSSKRKTRFRLMNRRCEKHLLMAKESDDPMSWVEAVRDVVSDCMDDDVDIGSLASFDLEYLFIKLRAASIGAKETVSYRDERDKNVYDVEVDLDAVTVVFPDARGLDVVDAGDGAKLKLRWPTARAWADPSVTRAMTPEDALDALIAHCVERVWVGDQSYDAASSSREEIIEFLDSLGVETWKSIREWAGSIPHLSYWVEWKNTLGEDRRVELRTLTDFFTFYSPVEA